MRDYAEDSNLPGWVGRRCGGALPAAAASSAAATAADDQLSGRIDGASRRGLSCSAATATAATPRGPFRRTRL